MPYDRDAQIITGPAIRDAVNAVPVELVNSYSFTMHSRLKPKDIKTGGPIEGSTTEVLTGDHGRDNLTL